MYFYFEIGSRDFYGAAPLAQRQFKVVGSDGQLALRTADNVAIINGEDVGIEVKYVSDFTISPYNPDSFAGKFKDTAGLTLFDKTINQATTYSEQFNSVIYHSNNVDFVNFYHPVFEAKGFNNIQFVLTPLKR